MFRIVAFATYIAFWLFMLTASLAFDVSLKISSQVGCPVRLLSASYPVIPNYN